MKLSDLRKLAEARTRKQICSLDDMLRVFDGVVDWTGDDEDFVAAIWNNIDRLLDVVEAAKVVNRDLIDEGYTTGIRRLNSALAALGAE